MLAMRRMDFNNSSRGILMQTFDKNESKTMKINKKIDTVRLHTRVCQVKYKTLRKFSSDQTFPQRMLVCIF